MFKNRWVVLLALLAASGCSDDEGPQKSDDEGPQKLVFLEFNQSVHPQYPVFQLYTRTSTPDLIENPPDDVVHYREGYARLVERYAPPADAVPEGCEVIPFSDDGGTDSVLEPPGAGFDLGRGVLKLPGTNHESELPLRPDAFQDVTQPVPEVVIEYAGGSDVDAFSIRGNPTYDLPVYETNFVDNVLTVDVIEARGSLYTSIGELAGYEIRCRDLRPETYVFDFDDFPGFIIPPHEGEVGMGRMSESKVEKTLPDGTRVVLEMTIY